MSLLIGRLSLSPSAPELDRPEVERVNGLLTNPDGASLPNLAVLLRLEAATAGFLQQMLVLAAAIAVAVTVAGTVHVAVTVAFSVAFGT